MSESPAPLSQLRLAIVGAGRLGNALANAMRQGGVTVTGPLRRGEPADGCDAILLCVPDAEIAAAASALPAGTIVGHTSGATPLDPLAPHERFSLHPLVSAAPAGTRFDGAGCAVAGSTPRASALATSLALAVGMRPFAVADADRPLYHAAASMASNYFVTLEWSAERIAALTGVRREDLVPLVRSAMEQWAAAGAAAALTGPVARGDEATVHRQREAIAARAADLLPLWDALTDRTRALAASRSPSAP